MALQKITRVTGRCVPVLGDDVDTDRIIPARFMKCVTFDGLGEFLFYDVRFDENKNPKPHPLNEARFKGGSILLGGNNFGCGSSREHAPQALYRYGFRALVAEGFAEIFFGNCTTLGIPCVCASKADLKTMVALVEARPELEMTLDLTRSQIEIGGQTFPCTIRQSAREGLVNGLWDSIGELLEGTDAVDRAAANLPYMQPIK